MAEQMPAAKSEDATLKCIYGFKVKLQNLQSNQITEYELVPVPDEMPSQNKISNYTDIGKAIWAKHVNDIVTVTHLGDHPQRFKIVAIDFAA